VRGVGPDGVKVFAKYLKDDAHLRASFEWFRAFPTDIADNEIYQKTKLPMPMPMPMPAFGADHSLQRFSETQVPEYATNSTFAEIENSGHWIYEEHPEEMTQRLLSFLR
jgi:pimeloyl-ACP methyl ester carboxylesterase